jgi:hypothetical protein
MKKRFSDREWRSAVDEAKCILRDQARDRLTITYSELASRLRSITIGYHDPDMDALLVDVSTEEFNDARPLLSVVVVHKNGDLEPGKGFYELADSLGFDTSDRQVFWIAELNRVFDFYSSTVRSPSFLN